jgi:hypothetical protein
MINRSWVGGALATLAGIAIPAAALAAVTTLPPVQVSKKVLRASAANALFLWPSDGVSFGPLTAALQTQGCDLADRVVIAQADAGAQSLAAAVSGVGVGQWYPVYVMGVEGCTPVDSAPGSPTAPRLVKIELTAQSMH